MIFITGANGWLGLNLIEDISNGETEKWGLKVKKVKAFILKGTSKKEILSINPNIEIFEGDLEKPKDIDAFLKNADNGILFHTAGIIHPRSISQFEKINHLSALSLLNKAHENKIKKAVIISSNSPCGCNKTNLDKDLFDENSEYNPYMGYGKSKMNMEISINKKFKNTDFNYTIIRAPWFYGPNQPPRQKLFFEMIKRGQGPIIGTGNNIRSMVYTKNLVQGIVLSVVKKVSFQKTYWIADNKPYNMSYILDTIEELLVTDFHQNCKMKRLRLPFIVSEIAEFIDGALQFIGLYHQKMHVLSEMNKNIACKVNLATKELGYKPEYELKEGMRESINEIYNK